MLHLPMLSAMEARMPEISRSETLRENERIKYWTGALSAWGNALVIGDVGNMVVHLRPELASSLGLLMGVGVLWMGAAVLTLLVAEGEI
jgi:hypothetical protein